jgi:hypothetical protein
MSSFTAMRVHVFFYTTAQERATLTSSSRQMQDVRCTDFANLTVMAKTEIQGSQIATLFNYLLYLINTNIQNDERQHKERAFLLLVHYCSAL